MDDLQEKELALLRLEKQLLARESLLKAGLPMEALRLIDCSSQESMEETLRIVKALLQERLEAPPLAQEESSLDLDYESELRRFLQEQPQPKNSIVL